MFFQQPDNSFRLAIQDAFRNPVPADHPRADEQRLLRAAGRLLDEAERDGGQGELMRMLGRYNGDPNRPRNLAGWLELIADHVEGKRPRPRGQLVRRLNLRSRGRG